MSSNLEQQPRTKAEPHPRHVLRDLKPAPDGAELDLNESARPVGSTRSGRNLPRVAYEKRRTVRLTKREVEILFMIAEGLKSREVAESLFLSQRTIDFHLANVYGKLNAGNRIQAILAAHHMGLLPYEPEICAAVVGAATHARLLALLRHREAQTENERR